MFRSVSACIPGSVVATEFVSTAVQELNIWSNVTINLNGIVDNRRPIPLLPGDTVEAVITTPSGYLNYQFYPYILNKKPQCFAVVNKNNYNPTIKPVDARKRWFNYLPKSFVVSWYNRPDLINLVGNNRSLISINQTHIVLDATQNSVVFYSTQQHVVSRVFLPAAPIDYKKIPSTVGSNAIYAQDLLVLCSDGKLYRINYLNQSSGSEEYKPAVTTSFGLDDLAFQEDIPGLGSFLDLAKSKLTAQLFPVVTSFDVGGNIIWLAGSDTVYTLTLNFLTLATYTIPSGEIILNLACVGLNAVVVTKSHKLFHIKTSGAVIEVYQSSALGSPCTLASGSYSVAVPEGNQKRIRIYQEISGTLSLVNLISTPEFVPAYCEIFNDKLWVTGHDSIQVLGFIDANNYVVYQFNEKVTLVSVVGNTILANHYLKDFVTLDLAGIYKTIPVNFESRKGPLSQIGTSPVQVKMLGQQGLVPVAGPGITYYVNGRLGVNGLGCNSGDYVGISYRAITEGIFRSTVVLGDTAYDYDIEVISTSKVTDYYLGKTTAINRITTGFGTFPGLDSGDGDVGFTGPIDLGFNFNIFGNLYSQIYVTTNGYIAFDSNNLIENNPIFGSLGVNAVYIEPKNLYQGLPINNVDPLNITTGFLETYETPGVYYQQKQLGEFKSYRIRWVGTSIDSYPFGNTITTTSVSTSNWAQIPVPDLINFQANDYISGNGITVSNKVLSKYAFNQNAEMYFSDATDEFILITQPIVVPKYTTVYLSTAVLGYVSNTAYRSIAGNIVLSNSGNIIVVDGNIHPDVTTEWTFLRSNSRSRAQSITVSVDSIIPVTTVNSNYIQVSATDYTRPMINQTLNGSGVTVPTKVIGFSTEYQRFRLTGFPSEIVEGANVDFSLYALNIPLQNGNTINYSITSTSANVTSTDFDIPLSGTMTVNGNYANLSVPISSDFTGNEGVETFSFSVVPESGLTLSVNISIYDPGPVSVIAPVIAFANSSVNQLYFVKANNNINQTASDPIYFSKTEIDFGKSYPSGPNPLFYQYNRVNLINGTVLNSSVFYTINFSGNFAVVSGNVSIPAGSNLLFKSNTLAPAYTYEVGFYTGKRFQYLEIFYDNQNHKFSNQIGISLANSAIASTSINASPNSSYVFGSETYDGDFKYVGKGSFVRVNQGFQPRYVDIKRVTSDSGTEIKYEFQLRQKITVGLARISLDYGELRLNDGFYDGNLTVVSDDIVSMILPVAKNKLPFAPLVSVGDFQFAFPAIVESEESKYPVSNTIYENQPYNEYITSNIAINQSGQYQLPLYYQSVVLGTGVDLSFDIIRNGNTSPWISGYEQLLAGDLVRVSNQLTSSRLYDMRDVVLVGPKFYRLALRTSSGPVFSYLYYRTLENPYVRYYQYDINGMDSIAYRSNSLRLVSNTGSLISGLLVETPGVTFLRNGVQVGNYISSINNTSVVALEILLPNYFISNIIIYQVKIDPWDSSNVYIPIGHSNVNNYSLTGGIKFVSPDPIYKEMTALRYQTYNALEKSVSPEVYVPASFIISNISVGKNQSSTDSNINTQLIYNPVTNDHIKTQASRVGNILSMPSFFSNKNFIHVESAITSLLSAGAVSTINKILESIRSNAASARFNTYLDTMLYTQTRFNSFFMVTELGTKTVINTLAYGTEIVNNTTQWQFEIPVSTAIIPTNYFDLELSSTENNSITLFDNQKSVTSSNHDTEFNFIGDANQFDRNTIFDLLGFVSQTQNNVDFNLLKEVNQFIRSTQFDSNIKLTEFFVQTVFLNNKQVNQFDTKFDSTTVQSNIFLVNTEFVFLPDTTDIPYDFGTTVLPADYLTLSIDFLVDDISTEIAQQFQATKLENDLVYHFFNKEYLNLFNGLGIKISANWQKMVNEIPIKPQSELYVDILWDQDLNPNLGAISANIGVYADNGRGGDMGLHKGVPPWRGPFVFYQKSYNLDPNGFLDQSSADAMAVKYVSAGAIQIVGTDYWNYRIFFDTYKVCVPRKGLIFPVSWLIKGG